MRWKAIVPIGVLIALVVGFNILFLDTIVKKVIIMNGQRLVGAKVEIESVHVSWQPFGIIISDISIANKEKPMQNIIQADTLAANIHLLSLIKKHIIIDEMSLTGLKINTKRTVSGALSEEEKTVKKPEEGVSSSEGVTGESEKEKKKKKGLSGIDINEIVNSHALSSVKRLNELEDRTKALEGSLKRALDKSTYEDELAALKEEAQRLLKESPNAMKDPRQFKELLSKSREIKKRLKVLKSSLESEKRQFQEQTGQLKADLKDVKDLSKKDYQTILNTLDLDQLTKQPVGETMLSKPLHKKLKTVMSLFNMGKQVIPTKKESETPHQSTQFKGVDVAFLSTSKEPQLWIKKIMISGKDEKGLTIEGHISDVTTEQDIINKPIKVDLKGRLHSKGRFTVLSTIDHRHNRALDRLQLRFRGWSLKGITFPGQQPMHLKEGIMNAQFDILSKDTVLQGPFLIKVSKLKIETQNKLLRETVSAISKTFIKGHISGTLTSPRITLSSDLSKQLTNIATRKMAEKKEQVKRQLKEAINKKVGIAQDNQIAQFSQLKLASDKGYGKKLANATQLESQLNRYEGELNTKTKEIEKKAKSMLEKEKKKLEKKLEKKLKSLF